MSNRVVPVTSALTAPYWEAAHAGRLDLQRCAHCRRFIHFPEHRCPWCGSRAWRYEPVTGKGTVHTFTVVWRTAAPGFADRVPYALAWVDLVEQDGLRAFGNVVSCDADSVRIGLPVKVCFEEVEGFGAVPAFEPDNP